MQVCARARESPKIFPFTLRTSKTKIDSTKMVGMENNMNKQRKSLRVYRPFKYRVLGNEENVIHIHAGEYEVVKGEECDFVRVPITGYDEQYILLSLNKVLNESERRSDVHVVVWDGIWHPK